MNKDKYEFWCRRIAERFGVSQSQLTGRGRTPEVALARMVLYWVLWRNCRNYTEVGRLVHRDRTTVRHGVDVVTELRNRDDKFFEKIAGVVRP